MNQWKRLKVVNLRPNKKKFLSQYALKMGPVKY
jgi:hypothetical protein